MFKRRTPATFSAATAILALVFSLPSGAEVIDAEGSGFTTRHSLTISGSREDVYRASVGSIGSWWSDDHTVSGRAANMYLEARPRGCFCERLGENGGVVHMTVTFVNPAVMLRLNGGLGPLGLMGVSGNMTWEFADSEEGTTLTWSYAVGGYAPGGLEQMAGAVDAVLIEQMTRLKEFIEE
jgi:uncharacterized protein YndB with AHSA1/START domain